MNQINPEAIPETLRQGESYVVWKYVRREGQIKPTKVPYVPQAIERKASSTDSQTWGTFDVAVAVADQYNYDGVGRVLRREDGLVFVDLDGCYDGKTGTVEDWAQKIVDALDSYTEISPSGTGLHIFVRGTLPDGGRRRKGQVEMYCDGRYATLTGYHLPGTPKSVEDRSEQIAQLYAYVFAEEEATPASPLPQELHLSPVQSSPGLTDEQVIELVGRARNSAKFQQLWAGDTSAYSSPSEADLALCYILAFYTQDGAQMDRLFRQSGLYREKWDRKDYREDTINKALRGTTEHYKPSRQRQHPQYDTAEPPIDPYRKGTALASLSQANPKSQSLYTLGIGNGKGAISNGNGQQEARSAPIPLVGEVVRVWVTEEPAPRPFVVADLIPDGVVTSLYGDGGVGKSYLALLWCILVCLGWAFAGRAVEKRVVLYLDGELDEDEFIRRAYKVSRGLGLSRPPEGLHYCKLDSPLSDKATQEQVRQVVQACGAKFIVLDSLSMATYTADPKDAAPTIAVIKYLETLGTVLAIDHHSKQPPGANLSNATQFGSAFKRYAVRSQLQLMRAEGGGATLQHKKANFGPLQASTNLAIEFEVDRVTFEVIAASDERMNGIEKHLPARERVYQELAQDANGAKLTFLASELGMSEKTVQNYLTLLRRQGRAEPVGDKRWVALPTPNSQAPTELGFRTADNPSAGEAEEVRAVVLAPSGKTSIPNDAGSIDGEVEGYADYVEWEF